MEIAKDGPRASSVHTKGSVTEPDCHPLALLFALRFCHLKGRLLSPAPLPFCRWLMTLVLDSQWPLSSAHQANGFSRESPVSSPRAQGSHSLLPDSCHNIHNVCIHLSFSLKEKKNPVLSSRAWSTSLVLAPKVPYAKYTD